MTPIFTAPQQTEQKKKKKVRPDEKKRIEEEQTQYKEDNEEGFQVVSKKAHRTKPLNEEVPLEDTKNRKPKNKGAHLERNDKNFAKPGKRIHDRQSGTGRGKEIAKGGAGGHHTWGNNPKNVAKDAEYFGRDDEAWFNSALSRDEKKIREEKQEEKEVVQEPQPVEERTEEQQPEAENRESDWRKKRRGGPAEEEIKKEDLLERPENALSVTEYRELLKQKNQGLESKPKNVVKANETDAQPQKRDESQFELGLGEGQKKAKTAKKDTKAKKPDTKEIVVDLKTDDGMRRFENTKQQGYGKGKKDKYYYTPDDFPEL